MRLNRKKWMLSALAALFLMTSGCASVKVDEIRGVKDSILSTAERLVVQDTETEAAGTEQGTENGTGGSGRSDGGRKGTENMCMSVWMEKQKKYMMRCWRRSWSSVRA